MNPYDFMQPPAGAPTDPLAMNMAMTKRDITEIFQSAPDVPPSQDASPSFDDMGNQRLSYNPDQYTMEFANGGMDMGMDAGAEMGGGQMGADDPLEQAYLQSATQERNSSIAAQDKTASSNQEAEMMSRRKMGL